MSYKVNFLPWRQHQFRTRCRHLATLLFIHFAIILLIIGTISYSQWQQNHIMEQKIALQIDQQEALQAAIKEHQKRLETNQQHLSQWQKKQKTHQKQNTRWIILDSLTQHIPPNSWLTEFIDDSKTVTLKVNTYTFSEGLSLVTFLSHYPELEHVKLQHLQLKNTLFSLIVTAKWREIT